MYTTTNACMTIMHPKFPKLWMPGKCKMHNGVLPNGEPQDFYYADNHSTMPGLFKGMKASKRKPIYELSVWPSNAKT